MVFRLRLRQEVIYLDTTFAYIADGFFATMYFMYFTAIFYPSQAFIEHFTIYLTFFIERIFLPTFTEI